MTPIIFTLVATLIIFHPSLFASDPPSSNTKPEVCIGCHGPNGNSPHPKSPSLAGQKAEYFKAQIKAYREGIRGSPIMRIVTRSIDDADAGRLADHFAVLRPRRAVWKRTSTSNSKFFNTCIECHGTSGEGSVLNPRIAGQQPEYTYEQLLKYKTGNRVQPEMKDLLGALPDFELKALAEYLGTLR